MGFVVFREGGREIGDWGFEIGVMVGGRGGNEEGRFGVGILGSWGGDGVGQGVGYGDFFEWLEELDGVGALRGFGGGGFVRCVFQGSADAGDGWGGDGGTAFGLLAEGGG
jgi:hypothetical protein